MRGIATRWGLATVHVVCRRIIRNMERVAALSKTLVFERGISVCEIGDRSPPSMYHNPSKAVIEQHFCAAQHEYIEVA
jgi:hypothetical protein